MAVKQRTLTQEIAWRLADVYAAQTHGNYDEETLFHRGGDWAADEVGKVLSERLGVPTEALEAGVVQLMVKQLDLVAKGLLEMSVFIQDAGKVDRGTLSQLALSMHSAAVSIHNLLRRVRGETS